MNYQAYERTPCRIKQSQPKKFLSDKLLHIDPSSDDTLFLFIDMSQLGHVLKLKGKLLLLDACFHLDLFKLIFLGAKIFIMDLC
jgi:hypothetical protein